MIQRNAEAVGQFGCYFLCIINLAEIVTGKTIDALRIYQDGIRFGFMDRDCFIQDAGALMSYLTGEKWEHSHKPLTYYCKKGELEIVRYELKETMKTTAHFICGDFEGGVGWDPYGTSRTVAEGAPVSKRIFRRML